MLQMADHVFVWNDVVIFAGMTFWCLPSFWYLMTLWCLMMLWYLMMLWCHRSFA